jgi:hypothetical protein
MCYTFSTFNAHYEQEKQMDTVHLFNYEIENSNSIHYGQLYWGIILEDSRTIYLNADKMVITDTGDLIAISNTRKKSINLGMTKSEIEDAQYQKEPRPEPLPLLALANGRWMSYFAASVMTGEPIGIDNSVKYEEEKK